MWAANHGNELLTRYLIKCGAAYPYKAENKKPFSPLHWAAFKSHVMILWLLMSDTINLNHEERDATGNTPLHHAAAGGSLECTECLMARGVDVFAKNDRGHTPYVLCTVPEVRSLLDKAMKTTACRVTGKQFSSSVPRYLCSWSHDVFHKDAVTQDKVYEHHDSEEKEKPVTWCNEVKNTIAEAEHQLDHAMNMKELEAVSTALVMAENKPVDCRKLHQCRQMKAKLESEIQLGKAMQVTVITNLEEFNGVHEGLVQAIKDAEAKGADAARISSAKVLCSKLCSEASLMLAM